MARDLKRSLTIAGHRTSLSLEPEFWQALQDLAIERAFVVAPVLQRYPLAPKVDVIPVWDVESVVGQALAAA